MSIVPRRSCRPFSAAPLWYAERNVFAQATSIESLAITWSTSKTRQVFRNVPIDSVLEIQEFAERFIVRPLKRFTLAGPSQDEPHHHQ